MAHNLDYHAIRRDVDAEVRKLQRANRNVFVTIDLLLFIVVSFLIFAILSSNRQPIPSAANQIICLLWLSWFGMLVFAIVAVLSDTKKAEDKLREQVASRIVAKFILKLEDGSETSQKRKNTYGLSDDGELEVVETPDADAADPVDAEIKRALRR